MLDRIVCLHKLSRQFNSWLPQRMSISGRPLPGVRCDAKERLRSTKEVVLYCLFFLSFHSTSTASYLGGKELRFEQLSLEQGLSQSLVLCIAQDDLGFLWFGTEDGLNRYDGYSFKVYRHSNTDSTSLANNYVYSLYKDSEGVPLREHLPTFFRSKVTVTAAVKSTTASIGAAGPTAQTGFQNVFPAVKMMPDSGTME